MLRRWEGGLIVSENDCVINEVNIKRLAQRLSIETNARTRRSLRQLLIEEEEEERFGLRSWHLELVDRHISDTTSRIDNQKSLIDKLNAGGLDASVAEAFLETLIVVRGTYEGIRTHLQDGLNRSGL
jgi:hypothetical protein